MNTPSTKPTTAAIMRQVEYFILASRERGELPFVP